MRIQIKIIFFEITFMLVCFAAFGAEKTVPYKIAGPDFKTVSGSERTVQNMPKIRSQDTVGLCYAFSSATLLQKFYCDDLNIKNCSLLPDDQTVSPVAITGLQRTIDGKTDLTDTRAFFHTFLPRSTSEKGGSEFMLLQHATIQHSFCAESFFPFDQFVEMNNFKNMSPQEAQNAMGVVVDKKISTLENTYNKYKTEATAVESCPECLAEIKKDSTLAGRDKYIINGLKQDSFEKFLFESYFRACNKKVNLTKPTFGYFPKEKIPIDKKDYLKNPKHPQKVQILDKIKELVGQQIPLQISICAEALGEKCESGHTTVISGYKKVCNSSNLCVDMIQLHNSYGSTWQEKTNGGWVVADDILNSFVVQYKENFVADRLMSWISKGPLENPM